MLFGIIVPYKRFTWQTRKERLYTITHKNALHFLCLADTLKIIFPKFGYKVGYMKRLSPDLTDRGDELFVPASHVLVTDRSVSHPAFRLWCVLHRLWFLREPPTMELLQELMGTFVQEKTEGAHKDKRTKVWQPATRRSIERWLKELEQAGWLAWTRRGETNRRYHLRTSARSATDSAVLTELRTMLNSGKATLADVQALLNTPPPQSDDAMVKSHESIPGSHGDAASGADVPADTTPGSHGHTSAGDDAIAESHGTTPGSHDATAESHDTTQGSHDTTTESHDAILVSHQPLAEHVLMPQNEQPYNEILQNQILEDPTPSPAAWATNGGGGGGPTTTERYLLQQGFSTRAAHEFCDLDLGAVQADLERRRGFGQGIGAIVITWRLEPPLPPRSERPEQPEIATRAASAKAQALVLAPADATPLEIQYLALDLEEGVRPDGAITNLFARRSQIGIGGVA